MKLHAIGAKFRTIKPQPGYPTSPLPGSRGALTLPAQAQKPRVLVVQRGPSYTHDARTQCAPGEQPFGAGFAALPIGHDITTGRPWGQR